MRVDKASLLVASIAAAVSAQPQGYGERLLPAPSCLTSGQVVSGVGRAQYCVDVEGPAAAGQKLVVSVTTPRPAAEIVRLGDRTVVLSSSNTTSMGIVGPLIEIKPFEQSCESCDFCPCLGPGCGPRCECSCNAMCRLRREPT